MNKKLYNPEHLETCSIELQSAVKAVLAAVEAIKTIDIKGTGELKSEAIDYVTAWDTLGQEVIFSKLRNVFPHDSFLGEEDITGFEHPEKHERIWVLDPIDGTANARADRPFSFMALGFAKQGKVICGVIYDVFRNKLYYAEKDKGCWCEGKQLKVSNETELAAASINTDLAFTKEATNLHMKMAIASPSSDIRMMGSGVGDLLEVAMGRVGLAYYTCLKPWDNAGVFALLQESGAVIKGIDGRNVDFTSMDVVTGPEALVQEFVEKVGKPFADNVKQVQNMFLKKYPELTDIVSHL